MVSGDGSPPLVAQPPPIPDRIDAAAQQHGALIIQKVHRGHVARQQTAEVPRVVSVSLAPIVFGGFGSPTKEHDARPRLVSLTLGASIPTEDAGALAVAPKPIHPPSAAVPAPPVRPAYVRTSSPQPFRVTITVPASPSAPAALVTKVDAATPGDTAKASASMAREAPTPQTQTLLATSTTATGVHTDGIDTAAQPPLAAAVAATSPPLDVKAALAAVEANGSLGGAATLSSRRMPSSRAQLRLNAATKAAGKVDGTLGKVQYADAATKRVSLADIKASTAVHTPRGARLAGRATPVRKSTAKSHGGVKSPGGAKSPGGKSPSKRAFGKSSFATPPGASGEAAVGGDEGEQHILNPTCLEMYLADDEFLQTFGMDKERFYSEKQWKQRDLKRAVGLW